MCQSSKDGAAGTKVTVAQQLKLQELVNQGALLSLVLCFFTEGRNAPFSSLIPLLCQEVCPQHLLN